MNFNKVSKILISFFLIIFLFSFFYFLFSDIVFADSSNLLCIKDEPDNKQPYPWCNAGKEGLGGSAGLINTIYKYSLAVAGVAALGAIIFGGIKWIISAGNPSNISEAKEYITGAIYGLILLISAALLFNTINPQITALEDPSGKLQKVVIKTEETVNSITYTGYDNDECTEKGCVFNGNSKKCTCVKAPVKNSITKTIITETNKWVCANENYSCPDGSYIRENCTNDKPTCSNNQKPACCNAP